MTEPSETLSKIFKKIVAQRQLPPNRSLYIWRAYSPDYENYENVFYCENINKIG